LVEFWYRIIMLFYGLYRARVLTTPLIFASILEKSRDGSLFRAVRLHW
jgi:hypothetical protein